MQNWKEVVADKVTFMIHLQVLVSSVCTVIKDSTQI